MVSPETESTSPGDNRKAEAFPKTERIASRRDFLRAYEAGRKEFARYTVVFGLENGLGHPRLGVTTTRKLGKSTVRNRFRRWVRETWRRQRTPLGLDAVSLDFVVNVKPTASDVSFEDFSEDLHRVLRRFRN